MPYVWFNLVLDALGKRIQFESISNLYGNAFAKDAGKIVPGANPLFKHGAVANAGVMGLMGKIQIIDATKTSKEAQQRAEKKILGDTSWAEGLM